jgi:hypothetical protein
MNQIFSLYLHFGWDKFSVGLDKEENLEIEKKVPAQPDLSSRSHSMTCFVVDLRMSF